MFLIKDLEKKLFLKGAEIIFNWFHLNSIFFKHFFRNKNEFKHNLLRSKGVDPLIL